LMMAVPGMCRMRWPAALQVMILRSSSKVITPLDIDSSMLSL
jgi:hypothetical protein